MAKLNDYNSNKLGTSNGTQYFPPVNLLEDKIPDSFPTDPNESAIAEVASEEVTNANVNDYFSYQHQLISPHGIVRFESGAGAEFISGTGKYSYSPLKDSLGGMQVYTPDMGTSIARTYSSSEVAQQVASSGKYYSAFKDPVPLPTHYANGGMTDIQFTNAKSNSSSSDFNTEEILDNKYSKQYILLYGNSDFPLAELTGGSYEALSQGLTSSEKYGFEKFRLGFLSLFFDINQKRNQWNYFYPTISDSSSDTSSVFTNIKNLSFPFSGNPLQYDRTINDGNQAFLNDLIVTDPEEYSRHISAIAYQLLVGGGSSLEEETVSFDTLPPGIEKKVYSDFNYQLNIPVSEEAVAILDAKGYNNISQDTLVADIKPVYNFTITNYHQAMPLIPEIRIPNIYIAAKDGLQGIFQGLKVDDPSENLDNYKQIPFFEKLADQFLNCDESELTVYSNQEYTKTMNIVWDKGVFTSEVEEYKEMFPMYVEVEFDAIPNKSVFTNELLDNLYDNQIVHEFIRTQLSYVYGAQSFIVSGEKTGEINDLSDLIPYMSELSYLNDLGIIEDTPESKVVSLNKENPIIGNTSLLSLDQKTFDFNKWFSAYGEQAYNDTTPFNLIKPQNYNKYTTFLGFDEGGTSNIDQFYKSAAYSNAKPTYKDQVIALSRTIDQILNGQKCPNIPLYYVIEKKDQETGTHIQNIIIPATAFLGAGQNQSGKVKYIDTQVKYGKSYSYSIKAHSIVIGSDYKFTFNNDSMALSIATQAGYSKIKKEDIIFATLAAFDGTTLIEYGDAFNYSSKFTVGDNNPFISLTTDQILQIATSTPGLDLGDLEQMGDSITFQVDSTVLSANIVPFYPYTETSDIKSLPLQLKVTDLAGFVGTENIQFTIVANGEGESFTYIDAETGLPIFFNENQLHLANIKLESSDEGFEFTFGGTKFVLDSDGTLTSTEALDETTSQIEDSNKKLAVIGCKIYPKVKVFETPYFEEQYVRILDNPPITPIINFYPYKDVKNSLLITFENQTGDFQDIPISILPEDEQVFFNVRKAQKKQWKDSQGNYAVPFLRFKSDDFASEYQVFRIREDKPSSYKDFNNSLYQIIDVRERTAFIDKLESNVKYYYVFRTVDLHQNISNPSYLYEVEMVENSGVSYPLINVVDFAEPPKDLNSRFFNRYMKIEPALPQKIVNEEKSVILPNGNNIGVNTPMLGLREETIWNQKKFKFRIKSVNTGKAIDLNIRFKTNYKQPDPINSCE